MSKKICVAVTSGSFSKNQTLINELSELGVDVHANREGKKFDQPGLVEFLNAASPDAAIIGLDWVDNQTLSQVPSLKYIAKYGVGLDNINLEDLKKRRVELGWTGGVNRRSVAELVLGFSLGHLRNIIPSNMALKSGRWNKNGGVSLDECHFGIVGLGHIGFEVASLLRHFGVTVSFCDLLSKEKESKKLGVSRKDYRVLLQECDVLSFHVPRTAETSNMFSHGEIPLVKEHCFIINTSRGGVVDFEATCRAVIDGKLGGFATDVYLEEPFLLGEKYEHPNIYFTPHIGGNSHASVLAMGRSAIGHIRNFVDRAGI